jgi:hypothetical protein
MLIQLILTNLSGLCCGECQRWATPWWKWNRAYFSLRLSRGESLYIVNIWVMVTSIVLYEAVKAILTSECCCYCLIQSESGLSRNCCAHIWLILSSYLLSDMPRLTCFGWSCLFAKTPTILSSSSVLTLDSASPDTSYLQSLSTL